MKKIILILFCVFSFIIAKSQGPDGTPVSTPNTATHQYYIYLFKNGVSAANSKKILIINDSTDIHLYTKKLIFDSLKGGITLNNNNYIFNIDSATGMLGVSRWSSLTMRYSQLTSAPTIPTNTNQLTNGNGFISGITSFDVISALGYTPYSDANPSAFISSETDPNFNTKFSAKTSDDLSQGLSNKYFSNSLARTAISAGAGISYNNSTGVITNSGGAVSSIGLTSSDITVGGSSPITSSGTYTLTLPNVNSNVGAFNGSYTVNTKGQITAASNESFNNSPSVTIQTVAASANGNQLSSTKNTAVNYSVTIATTVSLSGNSTGYIVLEICATNSSTAGDWTEIARVSSGQSGTLVIGLTLNQIGGGQLGGTVPSAYYRRVRSVNTAGTPTYTYNSGQEIIY